ncbi:MAG: peptidase T [Lachnospiraceae bacterium]|nr:peptidase T [Lachnospiraceae bacterium]
MRAYERLLEYVKVWTTSDEEGTTVPSTQRQFDLARKLVIEMKELGIEDARVDDKCYVYGTIPATPGYEGKTSLGFIAHLDTAPDFSGENVKPQVIPEYDGGDVMLGESGLVLSPGQFPDLKKAVGRTLITTDGTTLLGADDKAGIAEIMTAAELVLKGELPHGKICIGFTPDEEIGGGAADLDIPAFGADFAYTMDGSFENEIEYVNFNAAGAVFEVHGFNIHPGEAKDKMINAALVACEINACLPASETPRTTEGYEGFFHLTGISGDVEKAKASYIIRDHSKGHFEARLEMLRQIEKTMNEKYGSGTVTLRIRHQYSNMKEKIDPCMHLIRNAEQVIRDLGMEPVAPPVRGGTDGAQLSFRGLPCPNLGTGGAAFHGPYEHITAEGMDFSVQVILGLIARYGQA